MIRHNNGHRRALEKIANHPGKFITKKIPPLSVSIETTLYHKGRIISQPDVIIELVNREIYIIEYKGNGNGDALDRARKQLENAKWWYGTYRPEISPEVIHTQIISGDDPKYKDLLRGR